MVLVSVVELGPDSLAGVLVCEMAERDRVFRGAWCGAGIAADRSSAAPAWPGIGVLFGWREEISYSGWIGLVLVRALG
jgi:hypothetical protein